MNEIKHNRSKNMPIMKVFLLFVLKLWKQLMIKNTIRRTERNISIIPLKAARSALPPTVETKIAPTGASIPMIPKSTVNAVFPFSFIKMQKNNAKGIYKRNYQALGGKWD